MPEAAAPGATALRSRFQQQLHDDSGVVAVVVALSISTFLLGFAALAVDTGIAYATKARLQSVADRLALGTASALPDAAKARAQFSELFEQICSGDLDTDEDDEGRALWSDATCSSAAWAADGNRSNGEVELLDPVSENDPSVFRLLATPQPTPTKPTAVRVSLPPSTVEFGLGAFFGFDSVDVLKSATARIGTSMGAGILPFAATQSDVANGQFCVVDPAVPPAAPTGSTPGPSDSLAPGLRLDAPRPATIAFEADGLGKQDDVTLTLLLRNLYLTAHQLKLHIASSRTVVDVPQPGREFLDDGSIVKYTFTVKVPRQKPGTALQIWVTGQQRYIVGSTWENFVSSSVYLTYSGRPPTDQDPCTLPQSTGRGFLDLARRAGGAPLEGNVRRGPEVQLYPQSLLDPVTNLLGDLCVQKIFQPKTSCVVSNSAPGFSDALKRGLFENGDRTRARLEGDCGNGTLRAGSEGGVDASRLVGAGASAGMIDATQGGGGALRQALVSGALPPGRRGWVSGTTVRCPRMAVLPVVSNTPSVLDVVLNGGKEITGFVYLWIDGIDADRGLSWNGDRLRSVSGYVVDPRYLPEVVSGSGVVGPYLGGTMPKEATLICDLVLPGTAADAEQPVDRCADAD